MIDVDHTAPDQPVAGVAGWPTGWTREPVEQTAGQRAALLGRARGWLAAHGGTVVEGRDSRGAYLDVILRPASFWHPLTGRRERRFGGAARGHYSTRTPGDRERAELDAIIAAHDGDVASHLGRDVIRYPPGMVLGCHPVDIADAEPEPAHRRAALLAEAARHDHHALSSQRAGREGDAARHRHLAQLYSDAAHAIPDPDRAVGRTGGNRRTTGGIGI